MYEEIAALLGISVGLVILFVWVGLVDAVLKGITLWYSAKNRQKAWFVCIFIFNTAGILPLIYLIIKKPWKEREYGDIGTKKKIKKI